MKTILFCLTFLLVGSFFVQAQDIEAGKTLFKSNCAACHTVGKGKLTGPDLKDLTQRVDLEWIIPFVKNSTAVIESGDAYAVKIFNEFNKTVMTAHPQLTDEDITNIVGYITDASVVVEPTTQVGQSGQMYDNTSMPVINNVEESAIDMPVVVMIFWASVILIAAMLISLAIIVVRLLK